MISFVYLNTVFFDKGNVAFIKHYKIGYQVVDQNCRNILFLLECASFLIQI